MGRVSLTESYDDRSVISKLNEMDKRVTENTTVVTSAEASAKASAQAAQETADRFAGSVGAVVQNANAQINASKAQVDQAKAEVDETVTAVAQAVQTANQASASAQQSATTVEGYDARLTATESKNDQQDTTISALQTADGQNVKLTENQDITGIKTVPTEATGARSQQIANSAKVGAELDNYGHMLRTTGNQNFSGIKNTTSNFIGTYYGANGIDKSSGIVIAERDTKVDIVTNPTILRFFPPLLFEDGAGHRVGGLRIVHNTNGTCSLCVSLRNADGTSKNIMLATSDP